MTKHEVKMSNRSVFALSAVAVAIATAFGPAQAQTAKSAESQASTSNPEVLDTITVTARRRAESAQDVPAPLTVVKGDDLAANRIERVQDLQQVLPNTNVAFVHARQGSVAVRGIGNNPAADGLDGSVGIYLDNVFLARPGMAVLEILDVDQLELLRGPQGTLFGKNTTAGVLNISTKKPTFDTRRALELSVGERGYLQGKATFSGAISDNLAGRLQVYQTHDDGDVKNVGNGQKLNGGDRRGVRGQLLAAPRDNLDIRIIADYHEEKSSYGTTVPYFAGPAFLARAAAAGATGVPTDPSRYEVNLDSAQQSNAQQGGLSAEINWTLGSGQTLTSISAFRFWDFQPKNDDQTNASGSISGGVKVKDRQFSQEIRLASPTGGAVDYVTGVYYFHQKLDNESFTIYGPQADLLFGTPAGTLANVTSISPGHIKTDSLAVFGQATWHANERFDITAGLRATKERKVAYVTRNLPSGTGAVLTAAQTPRVGPWSSGSLVVDEVSPSGLINLAYKLTENTLGYVAYSHGEKSGGVNLAPATGPALGASSLLIGSEKADNFELGFKTKLLNNRVFISANLFQTKVDGYQANTLVAHPTLGWANPVSVLTNVGALKSEGLEFDARALIAQGLTLSLNGSYDDARYTSFKNAPCSVEARAAGKTVCDLTGQNVVGAPRWIVNLGGRYEWNLESGVQRYFNANYAWRAESEGAIDNSRYARIPAYALLNVATGWKAKLGEQKYDLSLWVRNLTDKRYYTAIFQYPSYADLYTAAVGLPRTIGATLRYEF
jgi:iron complex outermembrane receptor protein